MNYIKNEMKENNKNYESNKNKKRIKKQNEDIKIDKQ